MILEYLIVSESMQTLKNEGSCPNDTRTSFEKFPTVGQIWESISSKKNNDSYGLKHNGYLEKLLWIPEMCSWAIQIYSSFYYQVNTGNIFL